MTLSALLDSPLLEVWLDAIGASESERVEAGSDGEREKVVGRDVGRAREEDRRRDAEVRLEERDDRHDRLRLARAGRLGIAQG